MFALSVGIDGPIALGRVDRLVSAYATTGWIAKAFCRRSKQCRTPDELERTIWGPLRFVSGPDLHDTTRRTQTRARALAARERTTAQLERTEPQSWYGDDLARDHIPGGMTQTTSSDSTSQLASSRGRPAWSIPFEIDLDAGSKPGFGKRYHSIAKH